VSLDPQISAHHLATVLSNAPAFADLSSATRQRVASLLRLQSLVAGEVVEREGGSGNALFLVIEGSIGITQRNDDPGATIYLGSRGPGEVVGELELLAGHSRLASMTAEEATVVASLSRADFDLLCQEFPQEIEILVAWMWGQLHSSQIRAAIGNSPLFRNLSAEAKSELEHSLEWTVLPSGATLFREGDPGNAMYLILNGRIQLFCQNNDGEDRGEAFNPQCQQLLAELGMGDTLGEMALLTHEPRSATAYALRDTHLALLDRCSFDRLIAAYPQELLGAFTHQIAERLREQNRGRGPKNKPPVSIAVLVCSPIAKGFAADLAKALAAFETTLHLNCASISSFSTDGAVAADAAEARLLAWLNEQETRYEHVVYEADAIEDLWTFRCLRQADVLLLAADAEENPVAIAARLQSLLQRADTKITPTVCLFHAVSSRLPSNTVGWRSATAATRHWHIRHGFAGDVFRIARFLTGRSIGLTLGGGFAFGLAHIGVIQAMREMDIPIDFVGGTSMGAIIALGCAIHFSRDQMLEIMERGCAHSLKGDYTVPIVSLLTGKKVAHSIGYYVGNCDIEDLWLPYFAISASLVHASMVIHSRGNALRSALASSRAPGIFPPLGWDDDVLVDGGLVNNVPSDVMRGEVGSGTVIAVDVSQDTDLWSRGQFDMHLSGWKVFLNKISPFSGKPKSVTIADILARIVRLGGVAHGKQIRASADLYLSPPLEKFTFRDFSRGEEMAKIGYDDARAKLEQWIARHGRPWEGAGTPGTDGRADLMTEPLVLS
jgi:predicted acylesterase/phospholipase RssA/CRP-like cAMP-binding protein